MLCLLEEGRRQYQHKLRGILFTDLPALIYEPLICQCGLENISFVLWVRAQYFVIYFIARIVLVSATGSCWRWHLNPFDIHPLLCYLSTFLLCGTRWCFGAILYVPVSVLESVISPKEPSALLLDIGMEKLSSVPVSLGCGTFYLCLHRQWSKIYVWMLIYVYTHIKKICLCFLLYL